MQLTAWCWCRTVPSANDVTPTVPLQWCAYCVMINGAADCTFPFPACHVDTINEKLTCRSSNTGEHTIVIRPAADLYSALFIIMMMIIIITIIRFCCTTVLLQFTASSMVIPFSILNTFGTLRGLKLNSTLLLNRLEAQRRKTKNKQKKYAHRDSHT